METKNILLASVVLLLSALLIAVAFNYLPAGEKQEQIQLPSYLTEQAKTVSSNSFAPSDDGTISFAADETGKTIRLVSVSGTITKTASPELAIVSFSVQTLDKSATTSQSDNAVLSNKVMEALKSAGIDSKDIETASYSLQEEFQWNEITRKSESVGYRTTNSIQAKVRDLGKVGGVIDSAVQAGANSVSGVSFSLTKEKEAELRTLALQEAAANAKEKAQSIATGLGISVGQVYSASESSNYIVPYYAKSYAMESAQASAPTPITPRDIEYSATVSVQFEIQ